MLISFELLAEPVEVVSSGCGASKLVYFFSNNSKTFSLFFRIATPLDISYFLLLTVYCYTKYSILQTDLKIYKRPLECVYCNFRAPRMLARVLIIDLWYLEAVANVYGYSCYSRSNKIPNLPIKS